MDLGFRIEDKETCILDSGFRIAASTEPLWPGRLREEGV